MSIAKWEVDTMPTKLNGETLEKHEVLERMTNDTIDYIKTLSVKNPEELNQKIRTAIGFYFFDLSHKTLQVNEQVDELDVLIKNIAAIKEKINSIDDLTKAVSLKDLRQCGINLSVLSDRMIEDMETMSIALGIMRRNIEPRVGKNMGRKSNNKENELLTTVFNYVFESMIQTITKTKATEHAQKILKIHDIQTPNEPRKAMEAIGRVKKLLRSTQ